MAKRERNSFLTPLDVRVQPEGKTFRLLNQFTYKWGETDIRVPAGFETDLASVPVYTILIISMACLIASHYVKVVDW